MRKKEGVGEGRRGGREKKMRIRRKWDSGRVKRFGERGLREN